MKACSTLLPLHSPSLSFLCLRALLTLGKPVERMKLT